MIEKLKLKLKKSIQKRQVRQIAANMLQTTAVDYYNHEDCKVSVHRLAKILALHMNIDKYRAANNKSEINSDIFDHMRKANLISIDEYRRNSSSYVSYDIFTLWTHAHNSNIIATYPCGSMPQDIAMHRIKQSVLKTLRSRYPELLNDKTALTLMCIKRYYPHSFFAKLPKDIIKIIVNHANNMDELPENPTPRPRTQ